MIHHALIVGHADADGHLIAEQVRRNLALLDSFDVKVVVDPIRTKDHTAWLHLDEISEIAGSDYVFFVDLMFAPATYSQEAESLIRFAQARPDKRFFLIDHHPLPLFRLAGAPNLRVMYRPDVWECAIGPRSGMMIIAALCEHQGSLVRDIKTSLHEVLATSLRRAAAIGGPLPGQKLLALLQADQWDDLVRLGQDDATYHHLPRGIRPAGQPLSKTMVALDHTASDLLAHGSKAKLGGKATMPYDTDIENEELTYDAGGRALRKNTAASSKDLGIIVTLLEVAALSLTTEPEKTFTLEQLMKEAAEVGGKDIHLDKRDVKTVLTKASFVRKVGSHYQLR